VSDEAIAQEARPGALDIGGPLASLPFGPLAGVSLVKI